MSARWRGWMGAGSLVGLAALGLPAQAEFCPEAVRMPDWHAGLAGAHSIWKERDEQGQTLLSESGALAGVAVALGLSCGPWRTELDAEHLRGTRAYAGRSSTGQPIGTTVQVRRRGLRLSALRALQLAPDWRLGLRIDLQHTARDLASVGLVQGYPEQHERTYLAAGLRGGGVLGAQGEWRWNVQAWLGGATGGRVELRLPVADPVRLRSGPGLMMELGAGLQHPLDSSWAAGLQLGWRAERIKAGPAAALWRQGQLVGAARQPATRLADVTWGLWLGRPF